ncbi:MAG: hypothetical protein E4G99_01980 [Anaerolineales bacterium]|nr:MAG: hypothetical protein E4G99_01980 [Anaerolineales bacterium]
MSDQEYRREHWEWWLLIVSLLILFIPILLQPTGVPFYRQGAYSDLLIAHLPNARFIHNALAEWGQIPLWNPTIYAGAPFAADPLSGMAYLPNWIAVAFPAPITFNLLLLLHMIWSAFGCYTLARRVGMTNTAGVVFGLAFAGTPKLFAHLGMGHISLIFAVSWTPWLLVAIARIFAADNRGRDTARYAAISGGLLGLIFLADPRWSLPGLLLASGFALHRWIQLRKDDRWTGRRLLQPVLLFVGFAMGVGALLGLPLWQYLQLSTRADLTLSASNVLALDWSHLLGFLQPILAQAEQVVYLGVAVLMLAVIGVLSRKQGSGFWSVVFVMAVVFSLGNLTPFFTWITRWLPGAGFLRVPTRTLFLAALAAAALAGLGVESLLEASTSAVKNRWIPRVSLSLVSLILMLGLGFTVLRLGPMIYQLITVGIAIAAGILIGISLRGRMPAAFVSRLWLILILFDLAWVNWAMIRVDSYLPIQAQRKALADTIVAPLGESRIFSPSYAIPQLTAVTSKLELVEGVNPLQLASYDAYLRQAVGFEEQGYGVTLPPFPSGDPKEPWDLKLDPEVLGRLNVTHVVSDYVLDDMNLVYIDSIEGANLYELTGSRPRAWVEIEPGKTWVPAEITQWSPNEIQVRASGPGKLVLSEVAYPGWQADLDGQPLQVQVSDGLFRSVMIPEGRHIIRFSFRPPAVYLGLAIFSLTSLLGVFLGRRR